MAAITGARNTTNILSDQLAIDISKQIRELEPNVQPLTVFSAAAGKNATVATKFSWLEDKPKARFDTTSGTATNVITVLPVTTVSSYAQHDQWLNTRTGEQFRVESVVGATINVTRGIGSTAQAMNSGDELLLIGNAQPENDTSKPARSDNPTKVQNFTQIFREPIESSGSLLASGAQVNPMDWPFQLRKAGREHVKDIEYTLNFGRKSADATGAAERRTTGGILSFIQTNQVDMGGDMSEAEFNAFMLQVMRYGSGSKLAMASGVGVSSLNKFPASKQQTKNDETTYGMNVTHYTSPFGSLNLVYHRLYEGTKYSGYIVVVDVEQMTYRHLSNGQENRDTHVRPNIQPNDQDGRKDELLTECGLECGLERTHGVATGITS